MHRSVRFVLQPYKSRNPPLAAVTQARRDANSGSYGYKAVVTKQPLNRGCPVPDIAHAPDQIGLLHENYPHVLAATFRFNAFFAHQAPILYYIFCPNAIVQIVEIAYIIQRSFMHNQQIIHKTAHKMTKHSLYFSLTGAKTIQIFVQNAEKRSFYSFHKLFSVLRDIRFVIRVFFGVCIAKLIK